MHTVPSGLLASPFSPAFEALSSNRPPPRHTLDASRILAFSHNSGLAKNSRTILAHSRTFSLILTPFSHILARFSVVTYVENTHPPTLFFYVFGSF